MSTGELQERQKRTLLNRNDVYFVFAKNSKSQIYPGNKIIGKCRHRRKFQLLFTVLTKKYDVNIEDTLV